MSDEPDLAARIAQAIAAWSDEDEDAFAALPHEGDAGLALDWQRLPTTLCNLGDGVGCQGGRPA